MQLECIWAISRYSIFQSLEDQRVISQHFAKGKISQAEEPEGINAGDCNKSNITEVSAISGQAPLIINPDIRTFNEGEKILIDTYNITNTRPVFLSRNLTAKEDMARASAGVRDTFGQETLNISRDTYQSYSSRIRETVKRLGPIDQYRDFLADATNVVTGIYTEEFRLCPDGIVKAKKIVGNFFFMAQKSILAYRDEEHQEHLRTLLSNLGITSAIIHCGHYSLYGLDIIEACRSMGIISIELQHGLITSSHLAYNHNKELCKLPSYKLSYPDVMLYWAGCFKPIVPSECLPIELDLEFSNYVHERIKKVETSSRGEKRFLYLTDFTEVEIMAKDIWCLFIALSESGHYGKINVRLHPKDNREKFHRKLKSLISPLLKEANSTGFKLSLVLPQAHVIEDIAGATFIVSGLSTCLVYIDKFNIKSLCITKGEQSDVNKYFKLASVISRSRVRLLDFRKSAEEISAFKQR